MTNHILHKNKIKHNSSWIKINVLVDSSIANIIESFNTFKKIHTFESCQRGDNEFAYIGFLYGDYENDKWDELTKFVFDFLGPHLVNEFGDRIDISVRINSLGNVQGELLFNKSITQKLQIFLKLLSQKCDY